jgi:hypothetical protein
MEPSRGGAEASPSVSGFPSITLRLPRGQLLLLAVYSERTSKKNWKVVKYFVSNLHILM